MAEGHGFQSWSGSVVMVTGATRGIGRAIAMEFAGSGARVVVHGRDEQAARTVVAEIESRGGRASAALGDLRDPEVCARIVEETAELTGRLDALVNNAGANHFTGVLGTSLDDWESCIDLDLRAPWLCAKAAAGCMTLGGSIVNVTSNHARATLPGGFPYNVAKAGADALTQALAIDLAPRGIRVNAIAPGYVDTEINDDYFGGFPDPQSARLRAEQLHLTGRLARSEEVAAAALFLCDARASGSTTGTVLTIDGGRSALMEDPIGDDR